MTCSHFIVFQLLNHYLLAGCQLYMISDDTLKNNTVSLEIKRPGYQSGVFNSKQLTYHLILKQILREGRSQDGGRIGRGDHFLFYKFIERTTER